MVDRGPWYEWDPTKLCDLAGRNPAEQITVFVLADVAQALQDQYGPDITLRQAVSALQKVDVGRYGKALLEVSHWSDIFGNILDDENDFYPEESNG